MIILATKTTTFGDVFKKSFLKMMPQEVSALTLVLVMLSALFVGLGIFIVYKKCFSGVVYDHSFNMSLVIMTILTSVIIVTLSSNMALSLGMVGALSIVRYRTAVKNPMDLMFMFWAIASGIAVGAQYYYIGLFSFFFVAVTFFAIRKIKHEDKTYVIILNYDSGLEMEERVRHVLEDYDGKLRSKIVKGGITELTVELTIKVENLNITDRLTEIKGVHDVTLVQYRGTYEL